MNKNVYLFTLLDRYCAELYRAKCKISAGSANNQLWKIFLILLGRIPMASFIINAGGLIQVSDPLEIINHDMASKTEIFIIYCGYLI